MAVLSNIRQRSALMIAVIAFALFAFIIDLFSSGGFSTTSKM
jgi:peptidyl-prolyl cis-trans isomerase D